MGAVTNIGTKSHVCMERSRIAANALFNTSRNSFEAKDYPSANIYDTDSYLYITSHKSSCIVVLLRTSIGFCLQCHVYTSID